MAPMGAGSLKTGNDLFVNLKPTVFKVRDRFNVFVKEDIN